jgi:hypothetical protein
MIVRHVRPELSPCFLAGITVAWGRATRGGPLPRPERRSAAFRGEPTAASGGSVDHPVSVEDDRWTSDHQLLPVGVPWSSDSQSPFACAAISQTAISTRPRGADSVPVGRIKSPH